MSKVFGICDGNPTELTEDMVKSFKKVNLHKKPMDSIDSKVFKDILLSLFKFGNLTIRTNILVDKEKGILTKLNTTIICVCLKNKEIAQIKAEEYLNMKGSSETICSLLKNDIWRKIQETKKTTKENFRKMIEQSIEQAIFYSNLCSYLDDESVQ